MDDQCVMDIVSKAADPQKAVAALIEEANQRWLKEEEVIDDTTICVAYCGTYTGG